MTRWREVAFIVPLIAGFSGLAWLLPTLGPEILLFCAFAVAFVLLPSYTLGRLLLPGDLSLSERICLGYPAVQAVLFCTAIAAGRLHQPLLLYGILVLTLASLPLLWRDRSKWTADGFGQLLALVCAFIGVGFVLHYAHYEPLPLPGKFVNYYSDDMRTTAFAQSALRVIEYGGYLEDVFIAGKEFVYHSLQAFDYALASKLTGIPPVRILLYYWPMLHWPLMAGALVFGTRRLAGVSRLQTGIIILLVLFTSGVGFNSLTNLQVFANFHPYFFGYPSYILFALLLFGYLSGRVERLNWAYGAMLFITAAGTKSVLLVMLPLCLLPVAALRIWRKEFRRQDMLLATAVIAGFVVLRLTMYTSTGMATLRNINGFERLVYGTETLVELALILLPYAGFMLLLGWANPIARHRMSRDFSYNLFVLCFVGLSTVLLQLINFRGGEMYFYWYSKLFLFLGFSTAATYALERRTRWFAPLAVAVLLVGLFNWVYPFTTSARSVVASKEQQSTDAAEYETMLWAFKNLPHNKLAITNRFTYQENRVQGPITEAYMDYITLSGLRGYVLHALYVEPEWKSLYVRRQLAVEAFFAAPPQRQDELLALLPVDYVLVCTRFKPVDFSQVKGLRPVYVTPSASIYEVVRNGPGPALDTVQHPLPVIEK